MKKILIYIGILSLGAAFSCSGPKGDKTKINEADSLTANIEGADKYVLDPAASVVEWVGYKPTGQHNGTLNVKSGVLYMKDNIPVGGEFVVDMKSLKVLDLTDPEYNGKLTGHLSSPDFFNIESHPEANFVITKILPDSSDASKFAVTGNLTIKGIVKSVTFTATVKSDGGVVTGVTPQFTIDRTLFDIRYKSNKFFNDLKDDFINDEFALVIKLTGRK